MSFTGLKHIYKEAILSIHMGLSLPKRKCTSFDDGPTPKVTEWVWKN
jgi:hypothetical protein